MAEIKVSQLPEASAINDEDLLMIVQGGSNKKITKANAKFASGDEVYVGDTEPTGEDDDSIKLWINPDEDSVDIYGNDIVNEYSLRPDKAYSCNYMEAQILFDVNSAIENTCTYSTDEFKTGGRWIDGKPIYRKVIVINNPDGNIQHGISNLGTVISATGNATLSNGLQQYIPRALTGWDINIGDISGSSFAFQKDSNYSGSYAIATARVVLEYTKTTD